MQLEFSEIARRFILFPERLRMQAVAVSGEPKRDPVFTAFVRDIEPKADLYRVDDIDQYVRDFLSRFRTLADWYRATVETQGIVIRFHNEAPWIDLDRFERWRRLTFFIDADALIMLEALRQLGGNANLDHLGNWGTYATSDDVGLERMARKGLSDIHTHLTGCECVPVLWSMLLTGQIRRQQFPEYSNLRLEQVRRNVPALASLRIEIEAIRRARIAFSRLLGSASIGSIFKRAVDRGPLSKMTPTARRLMPERALLFAAWRAIVEGPSSSEIAVNLDHYLHGKNLFLQRHVQAPGSNPGLANFRRFFDRAETVPPRRSPRLEWKRRGRMIDFAAESRWLRSIEFRISPFYTAADYIRFFRQFDQYIKSNKFLSRLPNAPQFHFVVHFIRRPEQATNFAQDVDFGGLRRMLDRQSAVLHEFRHRGSDVSRRIVGVDVANIERNCPADVFSPYLRLLRGDCSLDEPLYRNTGSRRFLRCWHALRERGRDRVPLNSPRLGLTCHAGEDFFHVADGLLSIWRAISGCNMGAGDRIGHGIALGLDVGQFTARYGDSVIVPRGAALDSLVWAYRRLGATEHPNERHLRTINDTVDELSQIVYGTSHNLTDLYNLQKLRAEPAVVRRDLSYASSTVHRLYRMDLTDRGCRRRRQELINVPRCFSDISESLDRLQAELVDEIVRRDISIEACPSSNLATGGFESMKDHPIFSIHGRNKAVKLTIDCDDPGTFGARIENELALTLQAVRERGDKAFTEDFLRSMVEVAHHAAFSSRDLSRDFNNGKYF